jgi:thiamine biosynthesis lipoprotein
MSDYRAQSELRELQARSGERVRVSAELYDILSRSVTMAERTEGAFDPTVGSLVQLWREARRTGLLPPRSRLDSARALTGWRRIVLDSSACTANIARGTALDLGGIAKGYIIEQAVREIRRTGIASVMIEAGGDIVVGDAPPTTAGWRIEVPGASKEFAKRAAALPNAAMSTSGPQNQNVVIAGVRYSHVVDPRTGMALTTPRIAYVIARDGAMSDALATALTVMNATERARTARKFSDVVFEVH